MLEIILMTATLLTPPTPQPDRSKDWRYGPIVYQVFVDRFAPPAFPAVKQKFFMAPRTFKSWDETPKPGKYDEAMGMWSHELDFWGGDLAGITSKLQYIQELGADVLYLTPV